MRGMTAEEVAKAIDAALKADITEFKLTGPISLCGIGDKERANPFAHNTTVTALDLSGTTGWPTVEFGDGSITDRIAGVPEECFSGCTALTRIVLPAEAKAIGFAAFQNCTALTDIDLSHITHIGNTAFKNSGLAGALTLAETSYIGANAFNQCEKLSRATLSARLSSAKALCPVQNPATGIGPGGNSTGRECLPNAPALSVGRICPRYSV